jgi:hypothetical protein
MKKADVKTPLWFHFSIRRVVCIFSVFSALYVLSVGPMAYYVNRRIHNGGAGSFDVGLISAVCIPSVLIRESPLKKPFENYIFWWAARAQ